MSAQPIIIGVLIVIVCVLSYLFFSSNSKNDALLLELGELKKSLETKNKELNEIKVAKTLLEKDSVQKATFVALETKYNQLMNEKAALESKISAYSQLVNTLKTLFSDNPQIVGAPINSADDINQFIALVSSSIQNIKNNLTALQSNNASEQSAISNLRQSYGNFNAVVEKINSLDSTIKNKYEPLKSLVNQINSNISSLAPIETIPQDASLQIPQGSMVNAENISKEKLDELIKYIRVAAAIFKQIGGANAGEFLARYDKAIKDLAKYTKVGNRVPIRFLKDTVLIGMDSNKYRDPNLIIDNTSYAYPRYLELRREAPMWCDNLEHCSGITYGSDISDIRLPLSDSIIVNRDIGEADFGREYKFVQVNGQEMSDDYIITSIVSAIIYNANKPSEYRNMYYQSDNVRFYPDRLIGKNRIKYSDIATGGDPWYGVFKRIRITAVASKRKNTYFNSGFYGQPSDIYPNNPWNVIVSKPELIDWTYNKMASDNKTIELANVYNYDKEQQTLDFGKLNNVINGAQGILFNKSDVDISTTDDIGAPIYTNNLMECINLAARVEAPIASIGRTPDANNKYWCQPRRGKSGKIPILIRNNQKNNTYNYDQFVRPGSNIDFDF